jgi:hypothetical protein
VSVGPINTRAERRFAPPQITPGNLDIAVVGQLSARLSFRSTARFQGLNSNDPNEDCRSNSGYDCEYDQLQNPFGQSQLPHPSP